MQEVSQVISPHDTMLDAGRERDYFKVGSDGLDICKRYLNGKVPNRIMDIPSGYGRVMRWFRAEWPDADIFGVELDQRGLDFVEQAFGATRVQTDPHLETAIPGDMDLIFSGSLLTHFDEWQWDKFLAACAASLAPDGIFVFTTHGRIAALLAEENHPVYGDFIDTNELYHRYKKAGFAFSPYSKDYPTFGLSLSSPEWVARKLQKMPSVKIVGFEEGGWGQDVWAIKKNPWPMIRNVDV